MSSASFRNPSKGTSIRISQAPPPTNPAVSGFKFHDTPVTSSTAKAAMRQPRFNPPRLQVWASKTSGETQAMKRRMWLRSIISFPLKLNPRSRNLSELDVERWTLDVQIPKTKTLTSDEGTKSMRLKVTLYLEVISSWCFWALPAWSELQKRYAGRVDFDWKIALMDPTGVAATR